MSLRTTTLEAFKRHLGITGTDEDDRLLQWLTEAEAGALQYCRPGLLRERLVEYHDGPGVPELVLERRPVTEVVGVWVDPRGAYGRASGAFGDGSEWSEGARFAATSLGENEQNGSILVALPGTGNEWGDGEAVWPRGRGNVKVEYVAGYSVPPADFVLAVHLLATAVRQSASKGVAGPLAGETIGAYSYSLASGMTAEGGSPDLTSARRLLTTYAKEPW